MPRRLLIVLLALGTLGGYASGFASLSRHRHSCHGRGWEERWGSRWEGPGRRGPQEPHAAAPVTSPAAVAPSESPFPTAQAPAPSLGPR